MQLLGWLAVAIVSMAISYLLAPKMSRSAPPPVEPPGEAETPTIEEGEEVPVFFGVVWTSDTTIVWWGDTEVVTRSYWEALG